MSSPLTNLRGIPGWFAKYKATIAATTRHPQANMAGVQYGLAASLRQALFSGSGEHAQSGTVAAVLKAAAANMSGAIPAIDATLRPAVASFSGGQEQSGTISAALRHQAAAMAGTSIFIVSDDFNRADAANLGGNWTDRNGGLDIASNQAFPDTSGISNIASYNTIMDGDDMEVSVVVGTLSSALDEILIPLGANTAGECALAYWFNASSIVRIYSVTSWALAGAVQRDQDAATYTTGDTLTFKRVGNVYTTLKNGVAISGSSWTDSGNVVPRDSSHRITAMGTSRLGLGWRRIDSFTAHT